MNEQERLRAAFQRIYGGRYDRPGLEERVMATANERRARRTAGPGLVAASAVAVGFAAVMVAVLLSIGRAPQPAPAGQPGPGGQPGPVASETPFVTPRPTATPSATPVVAGAPAACAVSQLTLRVHDEGAATSHFGAIFSFRNASATTCTLYGFPGLQMLDAQGRPLPTSVNWGSDYVVHAQQPALVTLRPGGEASFQLGTTSPDPYGLTCPTSSQLLVTPPNETRSLTIAYSLTSAEPTDAAGTHPVCGRFTVSPVYAGSGSQP
jgi:Protein of unknown function (DUF4232)